MQDSGGNLSVDFLVGFTIFMVAFIWVATLVPNLLLGVNAHGIDFDAVAYRTGVILAEDPGATAQGVITPWEFERNDSASKKNILRFGLAISKDTPNVLSEDKVYHFFSDDFSYPDDYRQKVIFGDYPYRFRICLQEVGNSSTQCIGETLPGGGYGYMRREVKLKGSSNATVAWNDYSDFKMYNTGASDNVTYHDVSMVINTYKLLNGNVSDPVTNPNLKAAYRIDPRTDRILVTFLDLNRSSSVIPAWVSSPASVAGMTISPPTINLTKVSISQGIYGESGMYTLPQGKVPHRNFTCNETDCMFNPPVDVKDNLTFVFAPGFFTNANDRGAIYINMTFGVTTQICGEPASPACRWQGFQYLNSSRSGPWDYNYNPSNVTQPRLRDAVLEVAVW